MAESLLNTIYKNKYKAFSAGVESSIINPYAVEVMKEIGIDISNSRSKLIKEFQGKTFDVVVTVCDNAKENCPFFPGKNIIHKSFKDPSKTEGSIEDILVDFRKTRDEIKNWIIEYFG